MMNSIPTPAKSIKKFPHSAVFLLLTFSSLWSEQCLGSTTESWKNTGSGNWNDNANWNTSSFPNGLNQSVNLGKSITAPSTITLGQDITPKPSCLFQHEPIPHYSVGINNFNFQSDTGNLSISVNSGNHEIYAGINAPLSTLHIAPGINSSLLISGPIEGTLSLVKSSSGTLILSGNNTYSGSGGTEITGGTLQAGAQNTLPSSGQVYISIKGAALDLNDYSQIIGNLGGVAGSIVNLGENANTTLTLGNENTQGFAGTIIGSGGIAKQGSGVLTLSGANTYLGGTQYQFLVRSKQGCEYASIFWSRLSYFQCYTRFKSF